MVVGFPAGEVPRDDRVVATGMVRTIVPVLVVIIELIFWTGAEVFRAELWKV